MSENPKKLFLLDGMALVYRAYFAFAQNPRITSYGLNTSAVFGFTNTLLDVLRNEKPTHMGVSFDTDAPTERHTDFEAYKAHRQEMPEDLAKSIPYVMRVLEAMCIPILTIDGYEADDIIGTLAKKAEINGFKTYMMTPDKDFGQLVSENIFIYKPGRQGSDVEIMGVPEILKKWEISEINQVIDILGLWGDAVDNIPGIPGIGEKTAKTLIQKYGSVENLIANAEDLKGKQKENVINFADQALLSKKLATINLNVPVEFDEEGLCICPPDREKLEHIFAELEFRTMGRRVFGTEAPATTDAPHKADLQVDLFGQPAQAIGQTAPEKVPLNNIDTVEHRYVLVETEEQRHQLAVELMNQPLISFDTETTGIEPVRAEIVGLSFSYKKNEGFYIPVPADFNEAVAVVGSFKNVLESDAIAKTGQNVKYDLIILRKYGVNLAGKLFDTMLAHYLIEPDMRHNMDFLSETYLNYSPVSIETLIGKKGVNQLNMRNIAVEKVKEYAAEDADITLQLQEVLEPMLEERKVKDLLEKVELPLIEVLADVEMEGVNIDRDFLLDYSSQLEKELLLLESEIYALAGIRFNIGSPKQLGDVLFEHLKLDPKAKKTKTGQYSTGEDVLAGLMQHEIIKKVMDYRSATKLKSTYVDALPEMINPVTGRVHTCFNQAVAATGRLSSNNPNLQNIPIRTEQGREVRKAFIPRDKEHVLVSADYSQIELRVIAEISKDPGMLEAFTNKMDIHNATAARIFGVTPEEVNSEMRRKAKTVNFGIIYGISAFGLAQRLEIPRKEAAYIIEQYFAQYSGVKKYMNSSINFAREHGYVETILGRRRYIRDINSRNATVRGFAERNAINAPIQGSAADMIKVAMINIQKRLKSENFKSKMILQVHDELLFDVPHFEIEKVKPLIKAEMENAVKLTVPIEVEVGSGLNWLEAH